MSEVNRPGMMKVPGRARWGGGDGGGGWGWEEEERGMGVDGGGRPGGGCVS